MRFSSPCRSALVAIVAALLAPLAATSTVHTKYFTGTLACFQNCSAPTPPAQAAFLAGQPFTGSYSYDDAVAPTSGDPSTFRDYGSGFDVSLNIGAGLYTLTFTNGAIEIARNHYAGRKDDVFITTMPSPAFGGTGMATYPAVPPNSGSFESVIKFSNLAGANILPDTLIANWPQTVAAWATAFAGVEFYIRDSGFNVVGFNGKFVTLGDAPPGPTISTSATTSVTIGDPISDTATLSGGSGPTGTVTFTVFGPNDATCANPPAFTVPATVQPDATATGSVNPAAAGTYRWIASYGGDVNNSPVAGACNDPDEASVVDPANPTLTATASPNGSAALGSTLSDSATLASGFNPGGTISFTLFGPADPTCSGVPVFTSAAIPVNGNGNYGSGPFTPSGIGTYTWVASYSGDSNNATATLTCGLPSQTVQLLPLAAIPTLGPGALVLLGLGLALLGSLAIRQRQWAD